MKTNLFSNPLACAVQLAIRLGLALGIVLGAVKSLAAEDLSSTDHLLHAKIFKEPLLWVGKTPPGEAENASLWQLCQTLPGASVDANISRLDEWAASHPGSAWTPSLQANLAVYHRASGRYTQALQDWQNAWVATQQFADGSGKRVADFTLVNWTHLLASLGRLEDLELLFQATSDRHMSELAWQQNWIGTGNAVATMKAHPEVAYRCGSFALAQVAQALSNSPATINALREAKSPVTGFSMSALLEMANKHHLELVAVRRTSGEELVVPSVIHWRQNHYAAIVGQRDGAYIVIDPTFGGQALLRKEIINEEASGNFLVPKGKVPAGWQLLAKVDTDSIFGKGLDNVAPPPPPPPCPSDSETCCPSGAGGGGHGSGSGPGGRGPGGHPTMGGGGGASGGGGGCTGCVGMPVWEVSEPEISLWLRDQPMIYQNSLGEFALKLTYHQRETRPVQTNIFSFGPDWNCNWLSYVDASDGFGDPGFYYYTAINYGGGGGELGYSYLDSGPESQRHTTMQPTRDISGNLTGFQQSYPNGGMATYGVVIQVSSVPLEYQAFLTSRQDAQGRTIQQFNYTTNSTSIWLNSVVDADGNTNTIQYANASFPLQITSVTSPYGKTVNFTYDSTGLLTNLVDVINLTNSFQYAITSGIPILTNLTTPYGSTLFTYTEPLGSLFGDTAVDNINRAIQVTQPDGGTHLFLYRDDSATIVRGGNTYDFLPEQYTSNVPPEPTLDDIGNIYTQYRNSFHWGPRQFDLLSTTNITLLTTNDYRLARLRNWLHAYASDFGEAVSETLGMEREPTPDGILDGQMVWYGYSGKPGFHIQGTNSEPSWIALVLPDGTTRYTYMEYNAQGALTLRADTYSFGGSVLARTNTYIYDANGIDLLRAIGPDGVTNAAYGYNGSHQVRNFTNGVGEVTQYSYDGNGHVTGTISPNGLVTTNLFNGSNFLASTYSYPIGGGSAFGTNAYTYAAGQVYTHTDERGLITTNLYDALERLTNSSDSRGAIVYTYNKLDLAQMVDRLNLTNSYGYDSMRRQISWTNALGKVTTYSYCACDSLVSTTDALNNTNSYFYDNQGQRLFTVYADGYAVTNNYNILGQVTNVTDTAGSSTTNWFNNQGLQYAVSNYAGQISLLTFDINDRLTNSVDANGVTITNRYDNLGRLSIRGYPDGGMEGFAYTTNGLIAYTNQLNQITRYVYDAARRKTAETNANIELTQYGYNPAGDLLTLIDGKNQTNLWNYDPYGMVTNKLDASSTEILRYKYDADARLTNRWSAAKTNTYYAYDGVGNLTNITYPISPSISLAYDALNRLTNMVDAVGTSRYTYTAASQLLSEDGPWSDDTVTYTYNNRLRSSLSLLEPNASAWSQAYSYDGARRLTGTVSPAGSFSYTLGGSGSASPLTRKLLLPNGSYITNTYDSVARMLSTSLKNSGNSTLDANSYGYDLGNERTQQVFTAGNYVNYTYDNIGQLKSALGAESGGATNRLQEQLHYVYDSAHNLNYRTNNALVQTFGVNNLNELTALTRNATNALTVAGTTSASATNVTVNGYTAVRYTDTTFATTNAFTLANGNNTFTAIAKDSLGRQDTDSVTYNLPATNNCAYDANGNLTSDGTHGFDYDDENQLIRVTVTNAWKSEFTYDGQMRRRIRKEFMWGGSWLQTNEVRYVYDGNLVIQERDTNNLPQVSYTRGTDMSGSLQGAGGISGMLAFSQLSTLNPQHSYYHCDGNGNITSLINAQQVLVAKYLYDPYGNVLSQSGSLADANLYRFSSKEFHPNSGMVYYLYRFYNPTTQRWLNRDPNDNDGFQCLLWKHSYWQQDEASLYEAMANSPAYHVDPFGLCWKSCFANCMDTLTGGLWGVIAGAGAGIAGVGGYALDSWVTEANAAAVGAFINRLVAGGYLEGSTGVQIMTDLAAGGVTPSLLTSLSLAIGAWVGGAAIGCSLGCLMPWAD